MPVTYTYIQYGGIWTTSQATDAVAAGTWATPPTPKLFSWGYNNNGQLGLGNTTNYSSPKQVGSLTTWSSISSGYYNCFVVKTDGTLWSWGSGTNGQLGLGNSTNYSSPKQVGALTNWLKVSSGYAFSVSIKTDGTLWSWGYNNVGQLGLGNTTAGISSPVQVGALTDWLKLSCGIYHTIAIKNGGTLWSWGKNTSGQLGLGNVTNYSSPVQVGSLTNWLNVSCGLYHSIATKADGTLWGWGANNNGQLGIGSSGNYFSSPQQVGSLTDWLSVSCSSYATIAIKTNGTLWSWGKNTSGQLGLGNTTDYSSPKQIGSLTNWSAVAKSLGQNVGATKTDGTLWAWGRNNQGQLGLGNTTNYSSPKQIGALTTWLNVACGIYSMFGIAKT